MAFAATKKQGTISGYWFDDDFFLWRYAFTFSEPSAASKFLEIAKDGKSIQDAADAVGVEIECDSDENVVKATSVGDRKATVITISEKLPCVEDWYKIAKSYDGKADVTCRALAKETGEKYFNEDGEEPIEESRKPKDKRVYAEIYSYGIPSHITWFDNLKTAKRELENHIASMTKVGDYEIFRDEEAADIKMQEGDFEITIYIPSGSEDVVDNDVEHVIIRPKKEPVKEGINKMNKQLKTDVTPVMNKIKVIGSPIDKSDFWFYTEEITDDEGNPTVFHAQEGTGDNLDIEDEEKGFVDYIYYDTYDGEINYSMINHYISGDDYDTLDDFESDGGMILLYNPYKNLTVKQICWKVLDMDGVPHPENLTAIILMTVSEIWG